MLLNTTVNELCEVYEDTYGREAEDRREKVMRTNRYRARQRKGTSNKVGCGIAARRNKRWNW